MSNLIPFAFDSQAVRVVLRDGDPWFVAADVCGAIGVADVSDAVRKLDADEKGRDSIPTLGGLQDLLIVNEAGLYTLALRSRQATTPGTPAHRFRKWVTSEVLPSLRRTGTYSTTQANTVPAESLAAAQAELLDVQRKLIDTQERLIASGGGRRRVRKAPKPLTSDDVAQMRKLRAEGMPITEIARRMQRSSATVSMMTRDNTPVNADLFGGANGRH